MGRGGDKGRKVGARLKLTKERQAAITNAIEAGCTFKLAAQAAGISETTLYNWLKKGEEGAAPIYREFLKEIKKAEATQAAKLLATIEGQASRDWKAAAWILERRHGYASPQALAIIEKARRDKPDTNTTDGADDIRKGVQQLQDAGGIDAALEDPGEAA